MKKIIISTLILLVVCAFYILDPAFKRELTFYDYSVQYDWRLFSNSFCNFKTFGHCHTNEANRINAEAELYLQLITDYDGEEYIKVKLKEVMNETHRFGLAYSKITKTRTVDMDTLKKYKDEVFRKILLK